MFFKKNKELLLIIFFMLFYIILNAVFLKYNVGAKFDFLFESDTPRVISDYSVICAIHDRASVHPLFILFCQPIILVLSFILRNKMFAIMLFSSFVGSMNVFLLYKCIYLINKDKKVSLVISILYGLSSSNIIFNSGIELYNLACLGLELLWYLILKIDSDKIFNTKRYYLLIILGIVSFGITITNYMVFVICLFVLFLSKYKFKNLLDIFYNSSCYSIILFTIQLFIWVSVGGIFSSEASYVNLSININNFKNLFFNGFVNNILGGALSSSINEYNYYVLYFIKNNLLNIILCISFYVIIIFNLIKNFNKRRNINIGLLLALLFNILLHLVYGNNNVFLYTEHFNYIIFILFGINLSINKKYRKFNIGILLVFTIYVFINNMNVYFNILEYSSKLFGINKSNIYVIIGISILFIILIFLYKYFDIVKKIFVNFDYKKHYKKFIYVYIIILVIIGFIRYNDLLKNGLGNYYTGNYHAFSSTYKDEVDSYKDYIKEYKNIKKVTGSKVVNINYDINYYFFGMGDRLKILYKNGKLYDISNNNVIYEFDYHDELVIPNEYMVLLKDKDNNYVKIYEDNKCIHINSECISGTEKYIELYEFGEEKYKNTLKVLYSEILFNIKDGRVYPNILVYDDVWYRDMAYSMMVLEYTSNIDLVRDYINKINTIYDMNNNGIMEGDNLGEVLYIVSFSNKDKKELIDSIITETNRMSDNGVLSSYVDFKLMSDYPSAWYNFGISKNSRQEFINNSCNNDEYSSIIWWYNDSCKGNIKNFDYQYAYLSWGQYHKLSKGNVYMGSKMYPLSYEINASSANYNKMEILANNFVIDRVSPTHTWMASEMFMYIKNL